MIIGEPYIDVCLKCQCTRLREIHCQGFHPAALSAANFFLRFEEVWIGKTRLMFNNI